MNAVGPNYPTASLYVGDLHPEVTEAMLFEKFSTAGPIVSIRVCRDIASRRSLGYAYVNFQQPADAERALDTMNFDAIKGRPVRIMWSQRDPTLRRSDLGNVFIENLDKSIDNKAMYDTFSAFGNILSCKVATDENGEDRAYGFVHFETEESALKAIKKVNGMLLNGRKVFVGKFIPRRERSSGTGDHARECTNVYIKNFGVELEEDDLRKICETYGKILSLKIMTDMEGNSRGLGFVSFESHEAAAVCVEDLNGKEYGGRQLFAGRVQKKSERSAELRARFDAILQKTSSRFQGVNLYIKNLDDDIDDERLRKEFSRFGNITSAKVMRNDKEVSRGFGFVCFSSQEEATKAVTEMNNRIISVKPLYVALAQRKGVRQAQLATQYMRMNMHYRVPGQQMNQIYPGFNTYYPTMPPQRNLYTGQLAQVRNPRWPTAQTRHAGQTGYQAKQGAARQFGAPARIRATIPSRVPVQGTPSARVPRVQGVPGGQTMRMGGAGPAQRTAYKYPQTRINQAAGAECVEDLNGKEYGGRQLFAGRVQKKSERSAELRARFDAILQETSSRFQGVNLYIKNLDDDIDDERLRKEFSRFGNITSAKVMRNDKEVSRGFGFVCFSSQEEATKAVTEMNNRIISVKPLYVALAQRKGVRQAQLATQYMRMNMHYRVPGQQMNQIYPGFNTYYPTMPPQRNLYTGQLAQVRNPRWPTAQTRHAGQTGYQAKQGAARQFGAPARIRATIPSRVPVQGTPSARVPRVQGVPGGQTMRMGGAGPAQRTAYKYPQTRINQAAGAECVEDLNGKEYGGRQLFAGRVQKKSERSAELRARFDAILQETSSRFQGVNLYIKNLDDDIDDERLRKEFSRFGNITSAKVMRNDKEVSRGFGFVCFSSQEEATKAVTEMNNRIISVKPLYVALAQRKGVRQAQLATQYMRMNMHYRVPGQQMNQIYPGFNTYYPTMPPQRNLYTGQLAQVRNPRWPTAQTRHAGQTGYQAKQGAARQFGAPARIRATIPSRVPVQGTPSARVPRVQGVPGGQTMRMGGAGPAQRTAYKYPQTRINQAAGAEETPEAQQTHQAVHVPGQAPLTAQMLARAQPHEQKQMLGERLFSIIQQSHGDVAGKITGMLLEMDNAELLHMLESEESLKAKINEALFVLAVHQEKTQKNVPAATVVERRVPADQPMCIDGVTVTQKASPFQSHDKITETARRSRRNRRGRRQKSSAGRVSNQATQTAEILTPIELTAQITTIPLEMQDLLDATESLKDKVDVV